MLPGKIKELSSILTADGVINSQQKYPYIAEIKSLQNYIISVPIILLFSYLFYNLADGNTIIALGKEDSFFEWLTALFYFVSFILLMLQSCSRAIASVLRGEIAISLSLPLCAAPRTLCRFQQFADAVDVGK